jgi:alkylation response protein AidB-like acyl-CoA dehydrogenase
MELDLTSDQELLRATTARFIEETCPRPRVRQLADSETGLPDDYLRVAAELGWFAMLVPGEHGGGSISGEGVRDLAIIAEERGRGLQPGPFVPINVVAGALASAGSAAQQSALLPRLAAGEIVATWVAPDATSTPGADPVLTVTAAGDGFQLSGQAAPVHDGVLADVYLVTAGGPGGLSQFVVEATTPGITVTPLAGLDITQRFASVSFDRVEVPGEALVGAFGAAAGDVERQLQLAVVLSVSEALGAIDVLFEMTRVYAIDRTAFGRPIGSFQAVKHQLADLSLAVESAKAVVAAAVRAVQAGRADAGEIASMAKAWVGDAGIDIAQGCFQVFGGIGYTWEHDSHLFLRRITMDGLLYGPPDWHRERICVMHGV